MLPTSFRFRSVVLPLLIGLIPGACSLPPFGGGAAPAAPAADMVLVGGSVFVADSALSVHEAIALRDGRVLAVGSDDAIRQHVGRDTRVVELDGRLVTPGFNDTHMHLGAGGLAMLQVVLEGTTSTAEIARRVAEAAAAARPGEWIVGRGWDQTRLPSDQLGPGGWPTKDVLDRAAPDNPVYLSRVDGHTAWANSLALEAAGVDRLTPDPAGGEVVRGPDGEPTGILKERAMGLVAAHVPDPTPDQRRRGIEAALARAAETGITSVQTSASARDLAIYRELRDAGELTLRIYGWTEDFSREGIRELERRGITAATGDEWLRTGIVKGYVDGTLGSRTAYMLEPFTDNPSTRGILRIPGAQLDSLVLAADAAGLQIALHAIGDAANRIALDAFERAIVTNGARDARHRIEHAQILDARDIPRFDELGVIASMQPTHATSDMRWAEERIGPNRAREGAYAWRSLLDAGATVAFGTDFYVEPMEPVQGLYSAVTRQSREEPGTPPGGWLPDQRLSIEQAIRLYTATPAIAEFQEDVKGTLEAGRLADMVVWDRNLLEIEPVEILEAGPAMTIVDGDVVYRK